MALRIIVPNDLDNGAETLLIGALPDSGAVHVAGNEWRYMRDALNPSGFLDVLKGKLPPDRRDLADRLIITTYHP